MKNDFLQCFLFGLPGVSLCMCCLGAKPALNMGRLYIFITDCLCIFFTDCCDFCWQQIKALIGLGHPNGLFMILFSRCLPIKKIYLGQMPICQQHRYWYCTHQRWAIIAEIAIFGQEVGVFNVYYIYFVLWQMFSLGVREYER